jgi:nicotinate dehydrogenase subunit A
MSHAFIVNGAQVESTAPDDTPLLDVLRDELDLKGSRFGCGQGLCGACTVLVDGRPVLSCDTPLWAVAGKAVTTVEALVRDGTGARVKSALIEAQAGQCGYCLSGIAVRLTHAIDTGLRNRAELADALSRNLCRCGAQPRILAAAVAVAQELAQQPNTKVA